MPFQTENNFWVSVFAGSQRDINLGVSFRRVTLNGVKFDVIFIYLVRVGNFSQTLRCIF